MLRGIGFFESKTTTYKMHTMLTDKQNLDIRLKMYCLIHIYSFNWHVDLTIINFDQLTSETLRNKLACNQEHCVK